MSDHIACPRTAKPEHNRGNLIRPPRAANWNIPGYLGVRLLVSAYDITGDLCVNQARVDRVYANAVLDVFQRSRPGQANYPMLGGDVGRDTGVAGQRAD